MNHKVRAKTIVGRSMPRPLMRKLLGDDWIANIEQEVARGLRQVERDASRGAMRSVTNALIGVVVNEVEFASADEASRLQRRMVDAMKKSERQR